MDVSIAEAKNKLPSLIRALEAGEQIVITRNGRPVAQLAPPPPGRRPVRFGAMRGRMTKAPCLFTLNVRMRGGERCTHEYSR